MSPQPDLSHGLGLLAVPPSAVNAAGYPGLSARSEPAGCSPPDLDPGLGIGFGHLPSAHLAPEIPAIEASQQHPEEQPNLLSREPQDRASEIHQGLFSRKYHCRSNEASSGHAHKDRRGYSGHTGPSADGIAHRILLVVCASAGEGSYWAALGRSYLVVEHK